MPETTALTIRRDFPRADEDLLRAFERVPTGVVCDAQGRTGALRFDVRPITSNVSFSGPALVVDAGPADNLAAWASLKVLRPGDVIVIATGCHDGCSVIGDNFAAMAKNAGAAAIVTDGMVRDVTGLEDIGLPVFARGLSPNSPWKNGPGSAGLGAVVGGVEVHSGDIMVGDVDGVVRVPLADAAAVAEAVASVREKERQMEAAWREGAATPGWLDDALAERGVRWVEG